MTQKINQNIIILENIRSAYNVGNIIRTADALGWNVWLSGYTPSPFSHSKVHKTSLGAEEHVDLQRFDTTQDALDAAKMLGYITLAAEVTVDALKLGSVYYDRGYAVVFGNEIDGVLPETLNTVDHVVYIPMQGIKESLNVGQTTAIFMWELGK